MPDMITVALIELRSLDTHDGELRELVVRDVASNAIGSLVLTAAEGHVLIDEHPLSDMIDVDRDRITWH